MSKETENYYADLLIAQYKDKPKAVTTIKGIQEILNTLIIAKEVENGFNVETAVGKQLDTLGKYIGVDRFYNGFIIDDLDLIYTTNNSLSEIYYIASTDEPPDLSLTINPNNLTATSILSDNIYRALLKLKIQLNYSNGSQYDIDNICNSLFAGLLFATTENDMTIVFYVNLVLQFLFEVALAKNIIPKPMGVGVQALLLQEAPFFAMTNYKSDFLTDEVVGFSTYSNEIQNGEMLTYAKTIFIKNS